jgi:hypothetical protein
MLAGVLVCLGQLEVQVEAVVMALQAQQILEVVAVIGQVLAFLEQAAQA